MEMKLFVLRKRRAKENDSKSSCQGEEGRRKEAIACMLRVKPHGIAAKVGR
jgi:hypothetical protein